MSASGERETQAPSFDLMPPSADSLVAQLPRDAPVMLHPDDEVDGMDERDEPSPAIPATGVDLGASLGSGERFVPTLEDLAQDWLAEPEPGVDRATPPDEGSGAIEVEGLARRAESSASPARSAPELEEAQPPWAAVDSTAEFSASAVARMEGGLSASASRDAWDSVPPASATLETDETHRRSGRGRLVALLLVAVALSSAGTWAWFAASRSAEAQADAVEPARLNTASRVVAAPPVDGSMDVDAEGHAAHGEGVISPPPIDDGLSVARFEVGLPGAGKQCESTDSRFSREGAGKLAACYEVIEPHHADRILVLWDNEGETRRRGVRSTPRAARLVSAAYLGLSDQPTGTWTVRLVRDDEGSLTELARRRIVIDP